MQPLDYEPPRPLSGTPGTDLAALVTIPVAAFALTVIVVLRVVNGEPFGIYRRGDAITLIGGPLLITALWLVWCAAALWRRRLHWAIVLPLACWGALNVLLVLTTCLFRYLREPWNT